MKNLCSHSFDTLWLNCSTCLQIYYRKASLDHLPIIMIWQTEQSLKNIAMAGPDLIECMPIYDFLICKTSSPIATIVSFMATITCVNVTWSIRLKHQKAEMGVLSLDPLYDLILWMIAVALLTGHMLTSPDAIWVTV